MSENVYQVKNLLFLLRCTNHVSPENSEESLPLLLWVEIITDHGAICYPRSQNTMTGHEETSYRVSALVITIKEPGICDY